LLRAGTWRRERLLIVGRVALTEQILSALDTQSTGVPRVIGIVDDLAPGVAHPPMPPLLGPVARLAGIVEETRPDRVLVALGERRSRTPIRALVESCVARGIVVEDASDYYERLTGRLAIESLAPTSIVFSRRFGPSFFDCLFARAISLAVAAAGLVLLAPLMAEHVNARHVRNHWVCEACGHTEASEPNAAASRPTTSCAPWSAASCRRARR